VADVIISADSHVVEPQGLWTDRLPRYLRDRGPHRRTRSDGIVEFVIESNGDLVSVISTDPSESLQDAGSEANGPQGGYDPSKRLVDVDADGVWAEVLYPTTGLFAWSMTDEELSLACADVYNSWVDETFVRSPRFACPAMVSLLDLELAEKQIEDAARRGFRGVMLPMVPPADKPFFLPEYDRLWAAAQANGLPVSFHVMTGFSAEAVQQYDAERVPPAVRQGGHITVTFPAPLLIIHTVMSGVFDRFPDLHLVLVETNTSWLAWVVEELEKAAENPASHYALPEMPSHYIRHNVHTTFMDDKVGLHNIEFTGAESLMWGSDYPHSEGTWPHTQSELDRLFAGVDPEHRAAITGGTAAKVFNIPLPS
jgi:predicted TIM-barrel fold metal-dependent hydrolase